MVNQIVVFAVTPRTGALRAIPGVFGCTRGSTGPLCQDVQVGVELLVADDGRSAYQIVGEQILVFNRDPGVDASGTAKSPMITTASGNAK